MNTCHFDELINLLQYKHIVHDTYRTTTKSKKTHCENHIKQNSSILFGKNFTDYA